MVGIAKATYCEAENGINSLHGPSEPDFGIIMAKALKKQRKIRGGHRAHIKKLLAQLEDSHQKIILREKLHTLKSLDSKILDLVDDESPFLLNATLFKHITCYERDDRAFVNQMLRSYVDDLS